MCMYQGLGQMLTMCLPHNQGCLETPKCAYIIYGQPLISSKFQVVLHCWLMLVVVCADNIPIIHTTPHSPRLHSAGSLRCQRDFEKIVRKDHNRQAALMIFANKTAIQFWSLQISVPMSCELTMFRLLFSRVLIDI